jgi:2-amino-4-hydroxy-6-hydroxymethyldihydropteridine diphosphokinase
MDRGADAPSAEPAPLVVVGLGSNLGDRLGNLRRAADKLGELGGVEVLARSSVFETAALGGPLQPDFLNAALCLRTSIEPVALLSHGLAVERSLGRRRPDAVRWGPRTIDIDVLWIAGLSVALPGLTVPHPRLAERPFALQPLLELVPGAVDPRSGQRLDSLPAASVTLARIAAL